VGLNSVAAARLNIKEDAFDRRAHARRYIPWPLRGLAAERRRKSIFGCFLGPGVAERGGAVEDGFAGFRVDGVGEEVAEALELEVRAGVAMDIDDVLAHWRILLNQMDRV
jgi:hypothetical protein